MTDDFFPQQQPAEGDAQPEEGAEQSPTEEAYAVALERGYTGPRDAPAHQVTALDGVPIEKAAAVKLDELNTIRKLQNLPPISAERLQAQPEQAPAQAPEQAPAQPARDPETGRFTSAQAVDYLVHGPPEPLAPEQAAALEQEQLARALESGEAVAAAGEIETAYAAEQERLNNLPGFESFANDPEAIARFDRVAEAYQIEEGDPRMLSVAEDLYQQMGGARRFGAEAAQQAEADAYEKALAGDGIPKDEFGFDLDGGRERAARGQGA